jgi:hypothetical protein
MIKEKVKRHSDVFAKDASSLIDEMKLELFFLKNIQLWYFLGYENTAENQQKMHDFFRYKKT